MPLDPARAVQPGAGQLLGELVGLEPVLARMFGEGTEQPGVQRVPRYFLEQQQTTGPEHPRDLGQCRSPLGHVMDDPEVHDGVDAAGGLLDGADVPDREHDRLRRSAVQPPPGLLDHGGVEIEGRDVRGAEPVEQDLHPDAAAAADLQHPLTGQVAAGQPPEPAGLTVVLVRGPQRVVHRGAFDGVELHLSSCVTVRMRTRPACSRRAGR